MTVSSLYLSPASTPYSLQRASKHSSATVSQVGRGLALASGSSAHVFSHRFRPGQMRHPYLYTNGAMCRTCLQCPRTLRSGPLSQQAAAGATDPPSPSASRRSLGTGLTRLHQARRAAAAATMPVTARMLQETLRIAAFWRAVASNRRRLRQSRSQETQGPTCTNE